MPPQKSMSYYLSQAFYGEPFKRNSFFVFGTFNIQLKSLACHQTIKIAM